MADTDTRIIDRYPEAAAATTAINGRSRRKAAIRDRKARKAAAKAADAGATYETYSRWPLFPLYIGAYVAIWGGWVSLGRMSGFGPTQMLPGIVDWTLDLSIVLPLGLEAYAAFSLGVWLTRKRIAPGARRFAKWSSLGGLALGIAGQVTYHSLVALGYETAPLLVVMVVGAVPVLTLAAASTLIHEIGPGSATTRSAAEETARAAALEQQPAADDELADQAVAIPAATEADEETATGHKRPVTDQERRQIVAAVEAAVESTGTFSERAIARKFNRSRSTISRIIADAKSDASAIGAATRPAATPVDDRPFEGASGRTAAVAA